MNSIQNLKHACKVALYMTGSLWKRMFLHNAILELNAYITVQSTLDYLQ
jgi:hypothetical protein